MKLKSIVDHAADMDNFSSVTDYVDFAKIFLCFIRDNIQAEIVSRNENNYRFLQYKADGHYNVTRPINSDLLYSLDDFEQAANEFVKILPDVQAYNAGSVKNREIVNRVVYTAQQCIGASLDALPANKSNFARKINGNLFERFVRLIINDAGLRADEGTVKVPVEIDGKQAFSMQYQHDLILLNDNDITAYGSVKTSSKDRLGKIFVDKFLHSRLTGKDIPYFAVFLNDVQRKGREGKYGVNGTFLTGHFKGYTIKLNPLDGVYYFDIRPIMKTEPILKDHIKTFDHFLFQDMWRLS